MIVGYGKMNCKTKRIKYQNKISRNNKKNKLTNPSDSNLFKIERALLFSATVARVLIESQKLSDDVDRYKILISVNKPIKNIDRLHRWLDENEYNWDNTTQKEVYGKDICNWIIHSYVFSLLFDVDDIVIGFLVSSDYDRNKAIYTISLDEWLKFIDLIISDDVSSLTTTFDDKKSDYIYTEKKRGNDF